MDTKVTLDGNALRVDFIGEGGEVVSVRMDDENPKLGPDCDRPCQGDDGATYGLRRA
ncbi:hypothetical protein [Rhizobium favelukesii]|uniref:hypothetical protein n=1 Tax=Rhizobium favelukesii TaxID=348824 RepID=UPI00215E59FA|nr:hypothetical protein [Rhizobium favelukesii]